AGAGTARMTISGGAASATGVTAGDKAWPGSAASLQRLELMRAALSASRTTSDTDRPAMAAACARAVPQAPPPITETVSSRIGFHLHVRRVERPARPRRHLESVLDPERQPLGARP